MDPDTAATMLREMLVGGTPELAGNWGRDGRAHPAAAVLLRPLPAATVLLRPLPARRRPGRPPVAPRLYWRARALAREFDPHDKFAPVRNKYFLIQGYPTSVRVTVLNDFLQSSRHYCHTVPTN